MIKPLAEFLAAFGGNLVKSRLNSAPPVTMVTADSRQVKRGALFFALSEDGAKFIPDALARGAVGAVSAAHQGGDIIVKNVQVALEQALRYFYDNPQDGLAIFGVTGTNGKSTTAYLLRRLLDSAMVSTVVCDNGLNEEASHWTTPPLEKLYGFFSRVRANGLDKCAMEFSSHALKQDRVGALLCQSAIFTNLTGEHLDYHKTMADYFAAKTKLFLEHLRPDGVSIVNTDDSYGAKLKELLWQNGLSVADFGLNAQTWPLQILAVDGNGGDFVLNGETYHTSLFGRYNIYNAAGAVIAARYAGVDYETVKSRLAEPLLVPGRLQKKVSPAGALFFVDYAHTDDALRKVLTALRDLTPGKLYVVFGAGGDRDKTKRPRMGEVAACLSDYCIVTNDNPRSENPETIIAEICQSMPPGTLCERIPDRAKALARASAMAQAGDVVLVAGKGHENYQEIKGMQWHFNDCEELDKIWQGAAAEMANTPPLTAESALAEQVSATAEFVMTEDASDSDESATGQVNEL